jgi:hypothetical protein
VSPFGDVAKVALVRETCMVGFLFLFFLV